MSMKRTPWGENLEARCVFKSADRAYTVYGFHTMDKAHKFWFRLQRWVRCPTVAQFTTQPDYWLGRGKGFLTKHPSKRATALMVRVMALRAQRWRERHDRRST